MNLLDLAVAVLLPFTFEAEIIQRELERKIETVFEENFLTKDQLKFMKKKKKPRKNNE